LELQKGLEKKKKVYVVKKTIKGRGQDHPVAEEFEHLERGSSRNPPGGALNFQQKVGVLEGMK